MPTEIAGIIREEEGLLRQEEKHEGQHLGRECVLNVSGIGLRRTQIL